MRVYDVARQWGDNAYGTNMAFHAYAYAPTPTHLCSYALNSALDLAPAASANATSRTTCLVCRHVFAPFVVISKPYLLA